MTSQTPPRVRMVELAPKEALGLLAEVSMGRVAFSHRALPTVRPVNHVLDGDHIVIRTHAGSALLGPAGTGSVVAYEADRIDPAAHTGWSVVVTGSVTLVDAPEDVARYQLMLTPWIGTEMDQVVRISTDIVTGYRLVGDPGDPG